MKIVFFDTKEYDKTFFEEANLKFNFELVYYKDTLNKKTVSLAKGFSAVCVFVHDLLDKEILQNLKDLEVKFILLRCTGFNNVDLKAATDLQLRVLNVPSYSPYSIAEHALAMILALNRKIPHAYNKVRNGDFSLDGLLGFELHEKTVGIIGTGRIGTVMAKIVKAIGCKTLGFDPRPNNTCKELKIEYVDLETLLKESDIITLHCNLKNENRHLINKEAIAKMKKGVMIINTSRGALIDTSAVVDALKSGQIGYLGLDVYEEEENLFFKDRSEEIIQDDIFARLLTFPNVLITSHLAFFTKKAMEAIANTTLQNLTDALHNAICPNELKPK